MEKKQEYHLAEGQHDEAFDEDYRIRTCDIGRFLHGNEADRAAFARELGEATREIGFAILEGHGIEPRTLRRGRGAGGRALPRREPRREDAVPRASASARSTRATSRSRRRATSTPTSSRAGCSAGARSTWASDGLALRAEAFWPRPEMEPVFRRLCLAHEALILPVMQSLLRGLGVRPASLRPQAHPHELRPAPQLLPAAQLPTTRPREAGACSATRTWTSSRSFRRPRVEGLQVLNRANMKWIRLERAPGQHHPEHRRLHAAHQQRHPAFDHASGEPAARPGGAARRPRVACPWPSTCGKTRCSRCCPVSGPPKYAPIKALEFHTRTTSKYYGDDYAVKA